MKKVERWAWGFGGTWGDLAAAPRLKHEGRGTRGKNDDNL